MSDPDSQCLFCKVASGEVPATKLRETERVLSFRDINPQAPTHVLVIPKSHHVDIARLAVADPDLLAEVIRVAQLVADDEGLDSYRLVFNTGAGVGQSVFHVHGHVLGGRAMSWPPG